MDLRSAVSARFSVDAPATLAFDYPTVAALAEFVASALAPVSLVRIDLSIRMPRTITSGA